MDRGEIVSRPAPASSGLVVRGVLVFRWIALAWMTVLALANSEDFAHPLVAWLAVGGSGAWTVWLSSDPARHQQRRMLVADLALAGALIVASAFVVAPGTIVGGPFFATAYPVAAVLSWGVRGGPWAGTVAGLGLGAVLVVARPINDVSLSSLLRPEIQSLATGVVLYAVAGLVVGLVSQLLERSAEEVRMATMEALRQRERAARLAERESLARQIHDSVLQTLAMVHKRGKEIAGASRINRRGIASLADLAAEQEVALRAMIMREPEGVPEGVAALRDALEAAGREVDGLRVDVSTVGGLLMEAAAVEEVTAAVRQLLHNVANHATTDRATVFADVENGELSVSVRDDGKGFVFDPEALRQRGKAGLVKSVIGRIEDLGGTVHVESAPGSGTIVEIKVPVRRE